MSENDELKRPRSEIAQLRGDIQTLYTRADAAYGEALACSLLLIRILRDKRRRLPALVDDYLDPAIWSRSSVAPSSPVGIMATRMFREIG